MNRGQQDRMQRSASVSKFANTGAACDDVYVEYASSKSAEERGKELNAPASAGSPPSNNGKIVFGVTTVTTRMDAGESRYAASAQSDAGPAPLPANTANPASRPAPGAARRARRFAKLQRRVQLWWESMPPEARRTHYLAAQITAAIGLTTTVLGPALKALGWRCEQVRLAGRQTPVWCAPGSPSIKRPVGRPRFHHLPEEG